jgi:hypothetical protein
LCPITCRFLDTMERHYIYKETWINNQINDKNTAKPNIIFETTIRETPVQRTPPLNYVSLMKILNHLTRTHAYTHRLRRAVYTVSNNTRNFISLLITIYSYIVSYNWYSSYISRSDTAYIITLNTSFYIRAHILPEFPYKYPYGKPSLTTFLYSVLLARKHAHHVHLAPLRKLLEVWKSK